MAWCFAVHICTCCSCSCYSLRCCRYHCMPYTSDKPDVQQYPNKMEALTAPWPVAFWISSRTHLDGVSSRTHLDGVVCTSPTPVDWLFHSTAGWQEPWQRLVWIWNILRYLESAEWITGLLRQCPRWTTSLWPCLYLAVHLKMKLITVEAGLLDRCHLTKSLSELVS